MEKVILHSKRYKGMFWDKKKEVDRHIKKDFVMEEYGISWEWAAFEPTKKSEQ